MTNHWYSELSDWYSTANGLTIEKKWVYTLIYIDNKNKTKEEIESTLIHELIHAISFQFKCNWFSTNLNRTSSQELFAYNVSYINTYFLKKIYGKEYNLNRPWPKMRDNNTWVKKSKVKHTNTNKKGKGVKKDKK
jgi:hypothetical protein